MEIIVDKLNPSQDWPQVQALLEATPMSSSIPLAATRPKDFENSYPLLSGETIDLVAKIDNKVVGFIHGRQEKKMAFKDGNWIEVDSVYLGDFRVDKALRRVGVATQLRKAIAQYCKDHDLKYGWGVVVSGNHKMMQFYQQFSKNAQPVLEYTVASRLLLTKPRPSKDFSYCHYQPNKNDFDILAQKLSQRFLGPVISGSDIQSLYQKHPEIQFYKRKGHPGISFAIWNQMQIKQLLLTKLPLSIKTIRFIWNILSFFTGAHPFPNAGQPWKSAEVSMLVDTHVAGDFENFIAHEAFKMGCHTFNIIENGLGKNYPEFRLKGPTYRLKLKLMSYATDDDAPLFPPDSATVDIDLAFV